jgi:hypothetical protein
VVAQNDIYRRRIALFLLRVKTQPETTIGCVSELRNCAIMLNKLALSPQPGKCIHVTIRCLTLTPNPSLTPISVGETIDRIRKRRFRRHVTGIYGTGWSLRTTHIREDASDKSQSHVLQLSTASCVVCSGSQQRALRFRSGTLRDT